MSQPTGSKPTSTAGGIFQAKEGDADKAMTTRFATAITAAQSITARARRKPDFESNLNPRSRKRPASRKASHTAPTIANRWMAIAAPDIEANVLQEEPIANA